MYKKLGIVLCLVIGAMLLVSCASDEGENSVEEAAIAKGICYRKNIHYLLSLYGG